MSYSKPLRSLPIDQSASPLNKTLVVGHKCHLGATNYQNPNKWTCKPTGNYNHLIYGGSKINLIFGTTGFSPAPLTKFPRGYTSSVATL